MAASFLGYTGKTFQETGQESKLPILSQLGVQNGALFGALLFIQQQNSDVNDILKTELAYVPYPKPSVGPFLLSQIYNGFLRGSH